MDISKLTDKNEMAAYEYCKQVVVESAQSDEHFASIDYLVPLLSDKNSYVRTRGFGLICCQSRWDKEGRIKSVWGKMIPLLNDPKPTVVRQCLASLHEVVLYLPELADDIVAAVNGIDLSQYKDSMSPLIKKDVDALLKIIGV
mgnify:CR=1 FL=1